MKIKVRQKEVKASQKEVKVSQKANIKLTTKPSPIIIVLLLTPLLLAGTAGATDISACGTITTSGALLNNISGTGDCLIIGANNIVIDGKGFWVTFATINAGRGVYNNGYTNVTIINLGIVLGSASTNSYGIDYEGISTGNITNNTIDIGSGGLSDMALRIRGSMINISYNSINASAGEGIDFSTNNKNSILNNTINDTSGNAIVLTSSNNGIISNTNGRTTGGTGIALSNSNNNIITGGNLFTTTGYAYSLTSSSNNNSFSLLNFSASRKISFGDTISWFNYSNDSVVSVSNNLSSSKIISRSLTKNWSQANTSFFDSLTTSTAIGYYNVTGLIPGINYTILNNSQLNFTLLTDPTGNLPIFTMNLTSTPILISIKQSVTINITNWANDYTNNQNLSFSSNFSPVTFNITTNEVPTSISWNVNNVTQSSKSSTLTYPFNSNGSYNINATVFDSTSNTLDYKNWTVNVSDSPYNCSAINAAQYVISNNTIVLNNQTSTLCTVQRDINNNSLIYYDSTNNTYLLGANISIVHLAALIISNTLNFNETDNNTNGITSSGNLTITNSIINSSTGKSWYVLINNDGRMQMNNTDFSRCGQVSIPCFKFGTYPQYAITDTWWMDLDNITAHDNLGGAIFTNWQPFAWNASNATFYNLTGTVEGTIALSGTIRNSTFYHTSHLLDLMISWGTSGGVYDSNIYDINNDGLAYGSIFYCKEGNGGCIFQNNTIHDFSLQDVLGVYGSNQNQTSIYRDNRIYNGSTGNSGIIYWRANQYYDGVNWPPVNITSWVYNNTITNVSANVFGFDWHSGGRNARIWNNTVDIVGRSFVANYEASQAGGGIYYPGDSLNSIVYDMSFSTIHVNDLENVSNQSLIGYMPAFVNINHSSVIVDMPDDYFYNYQYADVGIIYSNGNPVSNATITFMTNRSYPNSTDLFLSAIDLYRNNKSTISTDASGHIPLPQGNETNTLALLSYYQNSTSTNNMSYTVNVNDSSKIYVNINTTINSTGYNSPNQLVASATISPNSSWYRSNPNTYQNTTTIQFPPATNWSILPNITITVNASSDKNLVASWPGIAQVYFNTTIPEWQGQPVYLRHDNIQIASSIANATGYVSFLYTGSNGTFNVTTNAMPSGCSAINAAVYYPANSTIVLYNQTSTLCTIWNDVVNTSVISFYDSDNHYNLSNTLIKVNEGANINISDSTLYYNLTTNGSTGIKSFGNLIISNSSISTWNTTNSSPRGYITTEYRGITNLSFHPSWNISNSYFGYIGFNDGLVSQFGIDLGENGTSTPNDKYFVGNKLENVYAFKWSANNANISNNIFNNMTCINLCGTNGGDIFQYSDTSGGIVSNDTVNNAAANSMWFASVTNYTVTNIFSYNAASKGIYFKHPKNLTASNLTISGGTLGLQVELSGADATNTSIDTVHISGVNGFAADLYSPSANITSILTVSNLTATNTTGIYLQQWKFLRDVMVSNGTSSPAIEIYATGNNDTIRNLTTTNVKYGFATDDSISNIYCIDCNLTVNTASVNFYRFTENYLDFINVFSNKNPSWDGSNNNGKLTEYSYLDVNVTDSNGNPISGANITISVNNSAVSTKDASQLIPSNVTNVLTGNNGHSPLSIAIPFSRKYNATKINYSENVTVNDSRYIYSNINTTINSTGYIYPNQPVASATIYPNSSWYRPNPNTYQNTTTIQLPPATNWSILPNTAITVNASSDKNLTASWSGVAQVYFNTTIPEWQGQPVYLRHNNFQVASSIANATGFVSFQYSGLNNTFNVTNATSINITSWSNNFTNNQSLTFVANFSTINFNITTNITSDLTNWTINGIDQSQNFDNISIPFTINGTYYINVTAYNSTYSTSDSKSWKVILPTYNISGYVKDILNNPLQGATVSCSGCHAVKYSITDQNGLYKLGGMNHAFNSTVNASMSGYTSQSMLVNSTGEDITNLNFTLKEIIYPYSNATGSIIPWNSTASWSEPNNGSNISILTGSGITEVFVTLDARVNTTNAFLYARIKEDGNEIARYNITSSTYELTTSFIVNNTDNPGTHYYSLELSSSNKTKTIIYKWSMYVRSDSGTVVMSNDNVTAVRSLDTSYINSNSRSLEIFVTAKAQITADNGSAVFFGNSTTGQLSGNTGIEHGLLNETVTKQIAFIVAPNSEYTVNSSVSNGSVTLEDWREIVI